MRKIKKLMAVCVICFASASLVNSSLLSTSKVWKAIDKCSNPNKSSVEDYALWTGGAASGALATIALAGTGISTGGAVFVGLAIAA